MRFDERKTAEFVSKKKALWSEIQLKAPHLALSLKELNRVFGKVQLGEVKWPR